MLGILIIQEIGTDEQKVTAFRDLSIYGDFFSDACGALGTCEGDGGIKILKQYAESQFADLANEQTSTSGGRARVKPDVNIYHAMIALAGAYHPDGPVAAAIVRDRLVDACNIRVDSTMLAAVEQDISKYMEKARKKRELLIRKKRPGNKRNLEIVSVKNASNTDTKSLYRAISSQMWFWPILLIAILFLGFVCWKRMK